MTATRAALATLLLSAVAAPVSAQQSSAPNLAGLWTFESDLIEVCTFNGQARLMPTEDLGHGRVGR